jgi:septal ring factor EnvC (AmiA/AmiB activator)
LDDLVKENKVICKEYASKVYLASQQFFPELDEKELNQLDKEVDASNKEIADLKERKIYLLKELKDLNSEPTNLQINEDIKNAKKRLEILKLDLDEIEGNKIKMIEPSEMKKVEDIYLDNKTLMKKFKGCCIEIIDTFCEYGEKNRKELMVI